MKKQFGMLVLTVIFVLGIISAANAQQELIENLKVVSIKSIQVREGKNNIFLDVKVNITNNNDREIRLGKSDKGKFEFFLSSVYSREIATKEIAYNGPIPKADCDAIVKTQGDFADEKKEIGIATKPFFVPEYEYRENDKVIKKLDCENVDDIYLGRGGKENIP